MIVNEKDKESASSKEPWFAYLEEGIASCGEGTFECDLNNIMKDFLISTSDLAALDTALRIDTYYWEYHLPSDPLMKFEEDKGIAGFLNHLYELVFDVARLIPYSDPRQDMLVQLILELRKLPAKPFKIWNVRWPLMLYIHHHWCMSTKPNNIDRRTASSTLMSRYLPY